MNRKILIAAVVTSLFTAVIFLPSLHNGFVDWDDLKIQAGGDSVDK